MIGLLRAEWIKLRTVTMNWVLGIIALAFPLVVTLLTAALTDNEVNEVSDGRVVGGLDTEGLISVLTGTTVVSALLCGVIAAASITSEFGFGTIRPTFAATPQRTRVIIAKGLVVCAATTVLATVVQIVGWFVGSALATGQGATIDLDEVPTGLPAMVGVVVLTALMSLAGYGLGLIVRSTPAAVSILIVWPLIAEGLVGQLLVLAFSSDTIASWMPFQAGIRLAIVDLFDDGPGRLTSGVYFGAVALVLAVVGGALVNRRDA